MPKKKAKLKRIPKKTIGRLLSQVEFSLEEISMMRSSANNLEARFTLTCLKTILKSEKKNKINACRMLLADRWTWIQNTDYQYTQDFQSTVNQICIDVATALSKLLRKSVLELLMPSIAEIPAEEYLVSNYKEDLPLRDIVMTDDNKRIIIVSECLDGAVNDAKLKHATHFNLQEKALSDSETERVTSRCEHVESHYELISQLYALKSESDSLGSNVERLKMALERGDSFHEGTELVAGAAANVGMTEFDFYLTTISDEYKTKLFECEYRVQEGRPRNQSQVKIHTFEKLWNNISNPPLAALKNDGVLAAPLENSDYEEIIEYYYCSYLFSQHVATFLETNEDLFEINPYEATMESTEELGNLVNKSRAILDEQISMIKSHNCYFNSNITLLTNMVSNDQFKKALKQNIYELTPDESITLFDLVDYNNPNSSDQSITTLDLIRNSLNTSADLALFVLSGINHPNKHVLDLLKVIGKEKILSLIYTPKNLTDIIKAFPEIQQKNEFLEFLGFHIRIKDQNEETPKYAKLITLFHQKKKPIKINHDELLVNNNKVKQMVGKIERAELSL